MPGWIGEIPMINAFFFFSYIPHSRRLVCVDLTFHSPLQCPPPPQLYPEPYPIAQQTKGTRRRGGTHIIPHQHTIRKLQHAHHDQEPHEDIDQLDALRRSSLVAGPELLEDDLRVVAA